MNSIDEKIDKLNKLVPTLAEIKSPNQDNNPKTLEIDVNNGTLFGFGLMKQKNIAVGKWFVSKGTTMDNHQHPAIEWIIVYQGELHIRNCQEVHILKTGDAWRIDSKVPHGIAKTPEDTWFIGITIPADDNFPEGY